MVKVDKDGKIIWICSECRDEWRNHNGEKKIACNTKHVFGPNKRLQLLVKE